MASKHPDSLRQLALAGKFKGVEQRSLLWSAGGSVLLCLLLIEFWLIAGLFVDRGRVVIPAEDVAILLELLPDALGPFGELQQRETKVPLTLDDRGVLPTLWQSRTHPFGVILFAVLGQVPPLQSNSAALTFLLICTAITGSLMAMMYSHGRSLALRAAIDITKDQRQAIHRQMLRLGPSEIQDNRNGELQGLFTRKIDHLQEGLYTTIVRMTRDPLKLVLLVILALVVDLWVAAIVVTLLWGCWLLMMWQRRQGRAAQQLEKSRSEEKMKLLSESLRTTRLVRGYGKEMEAFEESRFQRHLTRLCDETWHWMRQSWAYRWGLAIVAASMGSLVMLVIGQRVLEIPATLSLPSALLILASTALMHVPLQNLWHLKRDVERGTQVAARVRRYIRRKPYVGQAVGAKFLQPLSNTLVFDNVVCLSPDKQKLLDGCSFQIKAGTQVAIVGIDALEARSVAYLLPRFLEPLSGKVLIDGEDVAWVTLESLRAEAIFVSKSDPFFTDSILENIRCGDSRYSLQDVTEATKITHAHNFIMKLSQGYETMIGEHGEQLDVGQAFRLGLARAVLRNPALLIIEEPEEPLDEGDKSLLDDAYNRIVMGRTVIFLPHRMSTLRRVDEIVLIHKGKVEVMGNHAALVKVSPLYRHWEYLHFNTFRHATGKSEEEDS